jgi:hypothetical protein
MRLLQTVTKVFFFIILSAWLAACGSGGGSDSSSGSGSYAIGDTGPAGGKVFYIIDGGSHGLEAAPVDQVVPFAPGVGWGCLDTLIPGADGTAIGTGAQNTADILAGCVDTPIAADIAAGYMLSGFTDWFLPSKDELMWLYINRVFVGGFADNTYWSSSEVSDRRAWVQDFRFGIEGNGVKDVMRGVRAIRAF